LTSIQIGGRPAVRFERIYDHPVARVWAAVTDPDQMRHWFPSPEVRHDSRTGGSITVSGDPYSPAARTSRVLLWEPPCRFAFEWEDDELHFTLSEHDRGCRLELVNILANRGAGARNAAGWEMCLALLDRVVAGVRQGTASQAGMEEFLPVLEGYRAMGVPDDGWLPDAPS
jgi:uncharacterized protein YndB with AHSA1/START domain